LRHSRELQHRFRKERLQTKVSGKPDSAEPQKSKYSSIWKPFFSAERIVGSIYL
jgi:hypothetical protein